MTKHLTDIHHIAILVADIEKSVTWYTTSFSCEVLYQDKVQASLLFNNIKLKLFLPSQQPPHIGFVRDDVETLGELRTQADGTKQTFLSDPTGNPVGIVKLGVV